MVLLMCVVVCLFAVVRVSGIYREDDGNQQPIHTTIQVSKHHLTLHYCTVCDNMLMFCGVVLQMGARQPSNCVCVVLCYILTHKTSPSLSMLRSTVL